MLIEQSEYNQVVTGLAAQLKLLRRFQDELFDRVEKERTRVQQQFDISEAFRAKLIDTQKELESAQRKCAETEAANKCLVAAMNTKPSKAKKG
jgi:hypothetical protein